MYFESIVTFFAPVANCNFILKCICHSDLESLDNQIRGYGVVDSISGFGPFDPGSNPGTLAGLISNQGMV